MNRLTVRDLRAINEALAARLAGGIDPDETGIGQGDYERAKDKIEARLAQTAGPDELT